MYFTDDLLYKFPRTCGHSLSQLHSYAPAWLPGDAADIAVTWDEQVQAAADCYNAGATVLARSRAQLRPRGTLLWTLTNTTTCSNV